MANGDGLLSDERCWVCLENFTGHSRDEAVRICQCRLWAHESCLLQYSGSANHSACCPTCRTEIRITSKSSGLLQLKAIGEGVLQLWFAGTIGITIVRGLVNGSMALLWDLGANAIELCFDEQQSEYLLGGPRNNPFSLPTGMFPFIPLREIKHLGLPSIYRAVNAATLATAPGLLYQSFAFALAADRQRLRQLWIASSFGFQMIAPQSASVLTLSNWILNWVLIVSPGTPFITRLERTLALNIALFVEYSRRKEKLIEYLIRRLQPEESEASSSEQALPSLQARFLATELDRLLDLGRSRDRLIGLYQLRPPVDDVLQSGVLRESLNQTALFVAKLVIKQRLETAGVTMDSLFSTNAPISFCLGAEFPDLLVLFLRETEFTMEPRTRDSLIRLMVLSERMEGFEMLVHAKILSLGYNQSQARETVLEAHPEAPGGRLSNIDHNHLTSLDGAREILASVQEFYDLFQDARPDNLESRRLAFEAVWGTPDIPESTQEVNVDEEQVDGRAVADSAKFRLTAQLACNLLMPYAGWAVAKCLEAVPFFARRTKLTRTCCALWLIFLCRDAMQVLTMLDAARQVRYQRVLRLGEKYRPSWLHVPRVITTLADMPRTLTSMIQIRLV